MKKSVNNPIDKPRKIGKLTNMRLLSVLFVLSVALNIYLVYSSTKLTGSMTELSDKTSQLTEQSQAFELDVSELIGKYDNLDYRIRSYLEAEGKPCAKRVEDCLDELLAAMG